MQRRLTPILILFATLGAGCLHTTPAASTSPAPAMQFPDAYPPRDGSIWPPNLKGPFTVLPLEHVSVKSFDGVLLDGFLSRPKLPDGVKAPVLINSSPYLADASDNANNKWAAAGYVMMFMSVRGTGNSGGCLDFFGYDEQKDQAELVNWAANQSWSNGRVGFFGGSYVGTTVMQAVVQDPPALKAAIAVAPVPDLFTMLATPQGALWNEVPAQLAAAFTGIAALPRVQGEDPQDHVMAFVNKLSGGNAGRLCPDVAVGFEKLNMEPATSMRDSAFWKERDLRPRLGNIRTPLMYTDGYYDDQYWEGAHVMPAVTGAPIEYIAGPWPHAEPGNLPGGIKFEENVMIPWFDFWLKGVGDVPANLGKAYWQDSVKPAVYPNRGNGEWHASTTWPPPESTATWFNLTAHALSTTEPSAQRSYRAVQMPEGTSAPVLGEGGWQWPKEFLCDDVADQASPIRLVYRMDPVAGSKLVAGIPTLDLTVTSDQPGGIVNAFLLLTTTKEGGTACDDPNAQPAMISFGAADLLFTGQGQDIYTEKPFPTNTPTHIQIEMTDIAQVVGPHQQLVLVIGAGNQADHQTRYAPTITIQPGTSEKPTGLTLPLIDISDR